MHDTLEVTLLKRELSRLHHERNRHRFFKQELTTQIGLIRSALTILSRGKMNE